ncbi:DNA glycosylase [Nocardioidaceae bacterium]|nr:DNA glycosylase [Nocardioidaceae bacterium]
MPEGDSVWKLARRLDPALVGQQITRSRLNVPRHATADLAGRTVLEHATHGKHLLTRLSEGLTLHTHLRMEGSWTVTGPGKRLPRRIVPDVRVELAVASGRTAYGLSLPVVELVETAHEDRVVGHLGPDPLHEDFDLTTAASRLASEPGVPVVSALLDQRKVAGFGNLWANELCFLRGLSPWTPVGEVDTEGLVRLGAKALRRSARVPGAYQVTTGDTRRGENHYVSGRNRRPCLRCGTTIRQVKELPNDPANRVTWWCPSCQPGPGPEARVPTARSR